MTDGVTNPMRVDTSLLQGIAAANQAAQAKSTSLKSTGTTTSFSSALKSASSEKETTKPVDGQNYAEILTGPRAGMYVNTGGGARDGEAFVLVKHDGREDHIYGTGKDRKVVSVGGEQLRLDGPRPRPTRPTRRPRHGPNLVLDSQGPGQRDDQARRRPRLRRHPHGKRSGLYLNTSGNVRDGDVRAGQARGPRVPHLRHGQGPAGDRAQEARRHGRLHRPEQDLDADDDDRHDGQQHRRHRSPRTSTPPPDVERPAGSPPASRGSDRRRAAPTRGRA